MVMLQNAGCPCCQQQAAEPFEHVVDLDGFTKARGCNKSYAYYAMHAVDKKEGGDYVFYSTAEAW